MANDMLTPDALAGLPGAPFTEAEVDRAVSSLRLAVGWHVAPVRQETVPLDVIPGDRVLRLPTRALRSVEAVRNIDRGTTYDPRSYRVSRALARVRRGSAWPGGYETVEVDMTHGFDEVPADLLSLLGEIINATRRSGGVQSIKVDDGSVTFFPQGSSAAAARATAGGIPVPDAFVLPKLPGVA